MFLCESPQSFEGEMRTKEEELELDILNKVLVREQILAHKERKVKDKSDLVLCYEVSRIFTYRCQMVGGG